MLEEITAWAVTGKVASVVLLAAEYPLLVMSSARLVGLRVIRGTRGARGTAATGVGGVERCPWGRRGGCLATGLWGLGRLGLNSEGCGAEEGVATGEETTKGRPFLIRVLGLWSGTMVSVGLGVGKLNCCWDDEGGCDCVLSMLDRRTLRNQVERARSG